MINRIPKPDQLDKLCGEIVRSRGHCESCGKTTYLSWAHIISRRYRNTRWRLDNAFCLCGGCHFYYTYRPLEWEQFVIEHMGQKKYDELKKAALSLEKPDLGKIQYELEKQRQ